MVCVGDWIWVWSVVVGREVQFPGDQNSKGSEKEMKLHVASSQRWKIDERCRQIGKVVQALSAKTKDSAFCKESQLALITAGYISRN
jgi:hypothetical protein